MRVIFLCKRNDSYGHQYSGVKKHSGLYNSTRFISDGLRELGIYTKVETIVDGNCIDRVVTEFKPQKVVLEALFVTPEKIKELKRLHKHIQWFVHLHSNIPFLANEGIAIEWLKKYEKLDVKIIVNCQDAFSALKELICNLVLLPNVYREKFYSPKSHDKDHLDIGCFGAIRPLKNQLNQAFAAIKFARQYGKKMRFHINTSRIETGGDPVLKNLEKLFEITEDARLVRHHWMEPEEFVKYLHSHIDIGMQVSLSETFNVVTADYVTAGIPVVVSKEIKWVSRFSFADPSSVDDIVKTMNFAYKNNMLIHWNQHCLKSFAEDSLKDWYRAMSR